MSPRKFYAVNILSAFAWAPAHVFPGVLLGMDGSMRVGSSMRQECPLLPPIATEMVSLKPTVRANSGLSRS
jgi:membrane protein DedA with SNARE-associated domain